MVDYEQPQAEATSNALPLSSYQQDTEHTAGLDRLEGILQKFHLGKYADAAVHDILHDLEQYKQARSSIGKNGNVLHDIWIDVAYTTGLSSPEKELRKSTQEMHHIDAFYRSIEGKLWKLSDQVQSDHENAAAELEEILEGRRYAASEITRITKDLDILGAYYQVISQGCSPHQASTQIEGAQKYTELSPSEVRTEAYQLRKMLAVRESDKKNLNIAARRLHQSLSSHESARDELLYVINKVIKHKYDSVERHLQDASVVGVDISQAVEDLASVQQRVQHAQTAYKGMHAQASATRHLVLDALHGLSESNAPSQAAALRKPALDKSQKELQSTFDALDAEVDGLEEKMHQLRV